jgi:hypothetical protein
MEALPSDKPTFVEARLCRATTVAEIAAFLAGLT